jgi:hypothetical protein
MTHTKDEALKLALEALSPWMDTDADHTEQHAAYYAIKQALAAPVQPAPVQPVAFEVGLVEWVGNKLMATPKTTTTPPAAPKVVDCHANGVCVQSGLRAEMPAPVQEPVGVVEVETKGNLRSYKFTAIKRLPDGVSDLYTTPPAAAVQEGRDWSLLEATQESLREHMTEIKRLKEAQPAVPDAMTSADIQEHIEYVAGWNDCRQAMLKGMK